MILLHNLKLCNGETYHGLQIKSVNLLVMLTQIDKMVSYKLPLITFIQLNSDKIKKLQLTQEMLIYIT